MKPFKLGEKEWKKGQIVQRLDQRSYDVETDDGTLYRRNRRHIKKTKEMPSVIVESSFDDNPVMNNPSTVTTPTKHIERVLNK